ncbi:hypothetical protein NQ117_08955 [Paenibacillus sp. SC116]|uniref:hypothetical protein n=1 Tax=Paenibacillus sp. SC116 TaxID=2968986 RepID=UPI00215A8ABF|nr:hypothetical protein [Paenibacillus sp. SC116]MCR8843815.1 hypothetical protein [Paenibacillus sp. SC116]
MTHFGGQMQPLTSKELEYVVDCLTNEDLLLKQCAAAASQTSNHAVYQFLAQEANAHQQHYNMLHESLQQHVQLAPTQPQA